MTAYYNENDAKAAAWLRELIAAELIAPGDVDERSIEDVTPGDLDEYTQCHFFAGIGGWSYALRLAGWPDDRPVWTGSCPCQPFSAAGARGGVDDPRHLWPVWRWLIDQCRPAVCFGEQVASKAGRGWLAGVQADLEALDYRTAAADLCAASVGAPHIRQRLWWVADANGRHASAEGLQRGGEHGQQPQNGGVGVGLGDTERPRTRRDAGAVPGEEAESAGARRENGRQHHGAVDAGATGGVRHANDAGSQGWGVLSERADERTPWAASMGHWLPCADGKARRIEPGLEPLVDGLPGRVGLLRGYGNAIIPQVAQAFIESYLDAV